LLQLNLNVYQIVPGCKRFSKCRLKNKKSETTIKKIEVKK